MDHPCTFAVCHQAPPCPLYKAYKETSEEENKRQKDCLWKQRTHYGLENRSLGFIENLHKQ